MLCRHPPWSVVTSAAILARSWQAVYVYEHTSKTLSDAYFVELHLPTEAQRSEWWNYRQCLVPCVERSCQKMIRHQRTWVHTSFAHSFHMVIWSGNHLILHVCVICADSRRVLYFVSSSVAAREYRPSWRSPFSGTTLRIDNLEDTQCRQARGTSNQEVAERWHLPCNDHRGFHVVLPNETWCIAMVHLGTIANNIHMVWSAALFLPPFLCLW